MIGRDAKSAGLTKLREILECASPPACFGLIVPKWPRAAVLQYAVDPKSASWFNACVTRMKTGRTRCPAGEEGNFSLHVGLCQTVNAPTVRIAEVSLLAGLVSFLTSTFELRPLWSYFSRRAGGRSSRVPSAKPPFDWK